MGQSVIRNPRKIHSQSGGDPSLPSRVTNLENNEYKTTYYEIISGASGSITIPTGATINAGEFGLSGNAVLSKIDGSNKPTFESPKTSGGTVVTASLNETTGAWVASAVYTDVSVALIYSIKIKAINYSNLTYANIIETVDVGLAHLDSPTFTGTVTTPAINVSGLTPSQIVATDASKNLQSLDVATYPSLIELSYVKGLTSPAQTQLNNKVSIESILLGTSSTFNPADSTTYYLGGFIPVGVTTTPGVRRVYLGKNYSIVGVVFTLLVSSTLGTSENITVYVRVNNTTDYTVGTIKANSATQQVVINTSLNIALTSTDYFEVKFVTPAFATNPVNVSFASVVNVR